MRAVLMGSRQGTATALAALGLGSAAACVDKPYVPVAPREAGIAVRFSAEAAQTESRRTVNLTVSYGRRVGESVVLARQSVPVTGGTQSVSVPVDLAPCLADTTRAGARDACSIRIGIALRDAGTTSLDTVTLGPVDAGAGRAPTLPTVELSPTRFAVRQWVVDNALAIGSPGLSASATSRSLTGLSGTGGSTPTLYAGFLATQSVGGDLRAGAIGVFENGAWRLVPVPGGIPVSAVAPISRTEAYAVGFGTTGTRFAFGSGVQAIVSDNNGTGLWRFDGNAVTAVAGINQTDSLLSVAAFASGTQRLVMAGGVRGIIYRGDGTTFTRDSIPAFGAVSDLCITAPDEAFAVSSSSLGRIFRWDGARWTATSTPAAAPSGNLECPARGTAFAISRGVSFLKWNGSGWTPFGVPASSGARLPYFAAASATRIWAVGDDPLTDREYLLSTDGGTTWARQASARFATGIRRLWADPATGALWTLSGIGRLESVGVPGQPATLHSYQPVVRALEVLANGAMVAVGNEGFIARGSAFGQSWTIDRVPAGVRSTHTLLSISGGSANDVHVFGEGATWLAFNGTQWNAISTESNPIGGQVEDFYGADSRTGPWFIATSNGLLRCPVSGSRITCTRENLPSPGAIYRVEFVSDNVAFAVGAGGRVFRWNGQSWTALASPTTRAIRLVGAFSDTEIWLVADGQVFRGNGSQWTDLTPPGFAPHPVLGQVSQSPGTAATFVPAIGAGAGGSNRDVYLGSGDGKIFRWDGSAWSVMATGTTAPIISISIPEDGAGGAIAVAGTPASSVLLRGVSPRGRFAEPLGRPTSRTP